MINKILDSIEISKIRQISMQIKKYEDGIDFTIGEPCQDIPIQIREYMAKMVMSDNIGYTPTGGMIELKEKIAQYYNKYYNSDYKKENCLITIGATEGLSTFIRTIVEEGDEVIMPLPTYPGYAPNIKMKKGVEVYVDTSADGFKITADNLASKITPKTKAIIITTPNNPCGTVVDEIEMDKIAKIIEERDIYLLSDEIYASLTFSKFVSFAKYKHLKDKIVVINGFSKSHSMTGYRVGYMLAGEKLISNFIKVSQYTTTGIPTISQYGAMFALDYFPTVENIVEENKQRMEYLAKGLEKIGFNVIKPEGAFYLFASYEKLSNKKSLDFCMEIMENLHIGLVPGECFNVEGYIRISVGKEIPVLKQALDKLEKYFKGK